MSCVMTQPVSQCWTDKSLQLWERGVEGLAMPTITFIFPFTVCTPPFKPTSIRCFYFSEVMKNW